MTARLIVVSWLLGSLLGVRPMLRRAMLQKVCDHCDSGVGCDCVSTRLVVRGAKFERTGFHVFMACWTAAWWPIWLPALGFAKVATLLGGQVTRAVIAATPLTGPELERRVDEQAEEIRRLTEQIGVTPP